MPNPTPLRVALIAGSLSRGGAEKQFLYLARELVRAGVLVRVFALTKGDAYEAQFEAAGATVEWSGRYRLPRRMADLVLRVRRFRPHVVQAMHFFTNLYAVASARAIGCAEIGSIRNDTRFDMAECGAWGRPLLRTPRTIVANSRAAAESAIRHGMDRARVRVLANVIDLDEFDAASCPQSGTTPRDEPVAIVVARLVAAKRLDRFIRALVQVRASGVNLRGLVVGDGPQRSGLEALARELGLVSPGISFLGERNDVPALLAGADVLVLTSDHEGFPNALMEGMAARLPVITTPAGDAATLVQDGRNGFVVPFENEDLLVARLRTLASSPATRQSFGRAGRRAIAETFQVEGLARRALDLYAAAARQQRRQESVGAFSAAGC